MGGCERRERERGAWRIGGVVRTTNRIVAEIAAMNDPAPYESGVASAVLACGISGVGRADVGRGYASACTSSCAGARLRWKLVGR